MRIELRRTIHEGKVEYGIKAGDMIITYSTFEAALREYEGTINRLKNDIIEILKIEEI
jgi:hypothetical protein